jgi:ABC-type branched-subunit amino acid transport system substrate-binding protein
MSFRSPTGPVARRRRTARSLALLLVLALAAGACTRGDDDVATGGSTTAPEGDGSTTPTSGGGEGEIGPGDFGDLQDVCSDGDASGETAQGVTDDEIQVGVISDPGFVGRPGLNQELFDAAKVFAEWCNEAGGINGRELKVVERDAKLTEYKQRITEACAEDFFLVGGGAVFDDTGQEERLSCLLPDIPAYLVSPKARGAELEVPPLPSKLDELPVGVYQYLKEKFPDSITKTGFMTGNVPSTITVDEQNQEGAKSLGYKVVYQTQYNSVGEASWTPFAQAMQQKGVKGLVYTGEPENAANLLKAFDDIQYDLDWVVVGANHLDDKFIDVGGPVAKNTFMISSVVPPFLADENPATQQYLDLFQQYLPNGKSKALLGINSFSAYLLFATAVKECGSEVTRKCVYEAAKSQTEWTGGGLHAPTNPSKSQGPRCAMVVEATPEGFVVPDDFEKTDGLFRCSDDSVVTLEGDYGTGAKLSDVGKSLDDLE